MIYKLKKEHPSKEYHPLRENAIWPEYEEDNPGEGLKSAADPRATRHCSVGDRGAGEKGSCEDA